jgi:hypothetical protein
VYCSKHVEQLRNIGIINSTTQAHLVGYFYKICLETLNCGTLHGGSTVNIKKSGKFLACSEKNIKRDEGSGK